MKPRYPGGFLGRRGFDFLRIKALEDVSFQTNLDVLVKSLPDWFRESLQISGKSQAWVTGIVQDHRLAKPGHIFVARRGRTSDGHQFIQEAIQRGASGIVGEKMVSDLPVPYIQVEDGRLALAYFAAAFYQFPSRKLTAIGVTGTDGKTTTCNLIFNILKAAGCRVGMITTVNAVIGEEVVDTGVHVTTPEAPDVQRYLAEMVGQSLTHAILEVTSHGLEQHRVVGCDFDLAVQTNITHEHLDYHGSFEAYREVKSRLFTALAKSPPKAPGLKASAVLNRDDSSYDYLSSLVASTAFEERKEVNQITYGIEQPVDVRAENIVLGSEGLEFDVAARGRVLSIKSGLVGEFNVANILAAIAATHLGLDIDRRAVTDGIASTRAVPGRMEFIEMGQAFTAIVDFAHTPNALKRSLASARQLLEGSAQQGKIIAVFGSAGLRDRAKRKMMAEISFQIVEVTILTAEDPRTESLLEILDEMKQGAVMAGGVEQQNFWLVPDRREAIRLGVNMAGPGDILIALGKGHEQSMCYGEVEYPWDDRIAMRAALAEHLSVDGPKMPFLPDWK